MSPPDLHDLGIQALKGLGYYAALIIMMRLAGKRLAGQTTTFDLLVLITLGATIQSSLVSEGLAHTLVFVAVVFTTHRSVAALCRRSSTVRHLIRGKPRALVRDGCVIESALEAEGVSHDELIAGLRRLGYASPVEVRLAVLEETGHISAVGKEHAPEQAAASDPDRATG